MERVKDILEASPLAPFLMLCAAAVVVAVARSLCYRLGSKIGAFNVLGWAFDLLLKPVLIVLVWASVFLVSWRLQFDWRVAGLFALFATIFIVGYWGTRKG